MGTPSLLEGAIDAVDADVVKVAVQHVSVTTNDVLRAETIHAFWADRLMSLEREERDGSTPQIASELSAAAYRLVADACMTPIDEDAHVHHCFAEGRTLAEELLAKEKARLRAEERNRAATSIQKQARGRNRRQAMRDCDGVVISVQETTTKYALRKLWRGVPVQRAYVYCVKTAGGVYATAAETALRRSLDDVGQPAPQPSP